MDELELLKKDWKKREALYPKLSYDEIYSMILKKSSSIVKWIFIISLLEFGFWALISFALKDSNNIKSFNELDSDYLLVPLTVIGYAVLAYFFYLFYKNYKRISVTDTAKGLMEAILKTRRTVKQYVAFNLIFMVISAVLVSFVEFNQNEQFLTKVNQAAANGGTFIFYAKIIAIIAVILGLFVMVLLGFYWLIYGILLKKLNTNYHELKKLEV